MRPKQYIARVYILDGVDVVGLTDPQKYFLKVYCGQIAFTDKEYSLQQEINTTPQFYKSFEFPLILPGSAVVDIQVWQEEINGTDTMVGHTKVDLEDRYFSNHWNRFHKKPIELRVVKPPHNDGEYGKLNLWIDLIQKKD